MNRQLNTCYLLTSCVYLVQLVAQIKQDHAQEVEEGGSKCVYMCTLTPW